MGMVRTELLREGLTLAKDVKNGQGQLLIRGGVSIMERHLLLLRSWGVGQVEVVEQVGESVPEPVVETPEELEHKARLTSAAEELAGLFRKTDLEQPVMKELFAQCVARKAGAMR